MNGKATLAIMPLTWNADGWPSATVNDVKSASPCGIGAEVNLKQDFAVPGR